MTPWPPLDRRSPAAGTSAPAWAAGYAGRRGAGGGDGRAVGGRSAEPAQEAEEQSEEADGDAGLDEHRPINVGAQFGETGLELLGRDVVAVLSGLPDGISDGVRLGRREVGIGQRAGDGVRVEHRLRLPRRGSKAREGLVGGLLVGVRSGEDDALDGEQALGDLAEGDLDGVQAGVETCVVLAHVGAEFACRLVSSSNGVPTRGDGPRVRPLRR